MTAPRLRSRASAFGRTVVERTEPAIERYGAVGVVDLEVLVVEIVRVAVGVERSVADLDPFEAGVPGHGCHQQMELVEQHVERVRRHDPVDRHRGEVAEVLQRVHRQPRPRPWIHVAVVERVHRLVERRHVDEPVHGVEVELAPDRHEQHDDDDPDRMVGPPQPRDPTRSRTTRARPPRRLVTIGTPLASDQNTLSLRLVTEREARALARPLRRCTSCGSPVPAARTAGGARCRTRRRRSPGCWRGRPRSSRAGARASCRPTVSQRTRPPRRPPK